MSAAPRTARDERRRRLGQNFLRPSLAERLVAESDLSAGDLVVEVGPGRGALTFALARRDVRVIAVELDPFWAQRLRAEVRHRGLTSVRVVQRDFVRFQLPRDPFRVIGSVPFGATTTILDHLLSEPDSRLQRADLIVQWEVARKRAALPPSTLLSTAWAPWWTFELGRRIPAGAFRPVPRVDGGVLTVMRREPPLLPPSMAAAYVNFVRDQWQ